MEKNIISYEYTWDIVCRTSFVKCFLILRGACLTIKILQCSSITLRVRVFLVIGEY